MAFSDSTKDQAFARSGGRCECGRQNHDHGAHCPRGITRSTVQFHHVHAAALGGSDGPSNCEALCRPCHEATTSYGQH
jgi:5-methylcytosine-specific restriction endonuclease McrA